MSITTTKTRLAWQSNNYPVKGDSFEWWDVDLAVVHYAGVTNTPDGDPTDGTVESWLRNTQSYYARQRGYSIGYNFAVDWRGWSWELRGEDFECAANKYVNSRSIAFILITDGQDRATPAAVAELNRLLRLANEHAPRGVRVLGHWQTTVLPYRASSTPNTSCPGLGIKEQLRSGEIGLQAAPAPAPAPAPTPAPAPAPAPAPTPDTRMASVSTVDLPVIREGSRGGGAKFVQNLVNDFEEKMGRPRPLVEDGYFGPVSAAVLRITQARLGFTGGYVDAVCGAQTYARLLAHLAY